MLKMTVRMGTHYVDVLLHMHVTLVLLRYLMMVAVIILMKTALVVL